MAAQNPAQELINLLATRNFDPEVFDVKTGKPPVDKEGKPDNSRANLFQFDFIGDSGENYGTVEIVLADGAMTVGSGNNTGRAMTNPEDKNSWFDFLLQLKNFAVRHDFNNFQIDNISRMKYLKQTLAQLTESFQGRGQYSWSGQPTEARMLIKHSRRLAETDARFRHIESIFLETADGERYRLPTRSLAHGRAMLEHIRAGGRPWDSRGAHINHMVEQLQILSRFRRAHQGRLFEGDAANLINETNNYFGSLRRNLKSLATKSGYGRYFESWQPDAVIESELVVEDLRDLFVETRVDPRIEQALPLLAKIQEQNMKQAEIFETWANRLVEGTWAIPDTEEKMTKLKLFLSQPQPVGADADAATSALYDILGDDSLFDRLEELAETDPDADARPVVKAWLEANQGYPEVMAIVRELEAEPDVDQEVSMTAQDLPDQQTNMREGDNLANPLEEVMSPGAMAMFPEDQDMAEGSGDTIYPNAEIIKSKNGKPVGEIYQDGNSWGAFHYRADRGYDLIDSREDAIEALRDLHQETGRSRPDYTIKGVAEAGPFSYGKAPRKGSVADRAAKKRREQERGKQPIEPKDQQVGVAKVTKGVAEAINPDITNPAFSHQQQIGDYLYVARYWSKGLKITAYDGAKQIGYAELMYQSAPFDDFADPKTTPKRIWLESEWTRVDPKYQRQGIMSTMYAYAKMLGNSVKPSQTRSDDAKAAWKSWRQSGDAQHLTREGVAEGEYKSRHIHRQEQNKKYDEYRRNQEAQGKKPLSRGDWAATQRKGQQGVAEGSENNPVADAMFARLQQRPDLLRRYGVEYVIQAVHDVADSVGAVDEIGSSDVSGYMRQLEWNLKNKLNQYDEPMGDIDRLEETNDEKIAGRHDPKDFDAMVGRLKQLAGAGPMKTVWDEKKRVYRNVPTAQQPNKK